MSQPIVTVLMSVYNGEKFLQESIDSILNQTFKDFEFLIIDDCSTDASPQILAEYAKKDRRVRILRNEVNRRLPKSLNIGLKAAKGKYIARQDADDISEPERLAAQVKFLDKNPSVLLVGTFNSVIDSNGNILRRSSKPVHHEELLQELLMWNPFTHGSVMFRAVDEIQYDERQTVTEDYALWCHLALRGDLANLDSHLYRLRVHEESVSATNQVRQMQQTRQIALRFCWDLLASGKPQVILGALFRKGPDADLLNVMARYHKQVGFQSTPETKRKCTAKLKSSPVGIRLAFRIWPLCLTYVGFWNATQWFVCLIAQRIVRV